MTKTNLEHYKKELGKIFYEGCFNPAAMFAKIKTNYDSNIRSRYGQTYADDILDWMAQPYKEPILDDAEKEYLSAVIKPFRNKVKHIAIWDTCGGSKHFVHIKLYDEDCINFPNFKPNAMYKGMELRKEYTLKELGL